MALNVRCSNDVPKSWILAPSYTELFRRGRGSGRVVRVLEDVPLTVRRRWLQHKSCDALQAEDARKCGTRHIKEGGLVVEGRCI